MIRFLVLLLVYLTWAPAGCVSSATAGKKRLVLPDVAPTLVDAKAAGVTNPGARPLAELNDRQKMSATMAGVTQIGTSARGVTVHLTAELSVNKANVYAVAGLSGLTKDGRERFLSLPAAFQAAAPFGVDIGGVSPAFYAVNADSQFDSWVTVGAIDGSAAGALAMSPGLGLDRWSADVPFITKDGAVFWMDPNRGPTSRTVVVAQITGATSGSAQAVLQGRSTATHGDKTQAEDWSELLVWNW